MSCVLHLYNAVSFLFAIELTVATSPACLYRLPTGDYIVITGIAGCFTESENVYQFQDNPFNKVDMMTEDDRHWKLGEFMCCC